MIYHTKDGLRAMTSQPTDLIIPAAPKDYNKVPFVIDAVRKFVDVETIHVIAPNPDDFGWVRSGVNFHRDADVLPYDRARLRYRPNWVFQQMLKVFRDVTKNDWFLVMDADIFPNRRIPLWNADGQPILYLGRDQFYDPYFVFNEHMLGFGKVYPWSFLSECTLYSKRLVQDMLAHCGLTLDEFWEKTVEITVQGCRPGDAELYGSYVYQEHPDVYEIKKLNARLGGRYESYVFSDEEIETELKMVREKYPNVDITSMHSWES